MSGIIGKFSFDPDEPLAHAVLEQMLETFLRPGSRGPLEPSAKGVFNAPGIAIGWCSQRDESGLGSSVAVNERHDVRAVADSHISNAPSLRAHLQERGHCFRGTADSELIVHAYETWGQQCFNRFRGPFACAIWEASKRRLILARDHIGIRPLYFSLLPNHGIAFASELQPLLRDPGVGREWCPSAIDAYLALGYVPAPLTAYRRISKLEPAHLMLVEGRRLHVEPFWDLPSVTTSATLDERVAALEGSLHTALETQTSERGPGGILFSGGTASSVLLAAAPASGHRAVTVDMEEDASELTRSLAAARHLGRTRELEYADANMSALALTLAGCCDEPLADPSAIGQFAICLAARRHLDRAVTAHGAGALWAGYARHRVEHAEAAVRTWLRGSLAATGAHLASALSGSIKGARALSHLALPPADACAVKHAYGLWDNEHRRGIYTREFAWQVRHANPFTRHLELYADRASGDALDRALYVDARTFLPNSILPAANRAAAAAGLELAFPYLDVDLVVLAATTPSAFKQRGSTGMHALRQILLRKLPQALMPPMHRPAPHLWLSSVLPSMVPDVLLARRFDGRGIVSRPALRRLWEEHRQGQRNHSRRLWSLLMLEFWFREFIDGDAAAEPLEYAVLLKAAA